MNVKSAPSIDSWETSQAAALRKIRDAAKGSDSETLKDLAKEADPKEKAERQKNCEVIRRIVDKCVEDYREGEYSFKEAVDMICEALEDVK